MITPPRWTRYLSFRSILSILIPSLAVALYVAAVYLPRLAPPPHPDSVTPQVMGIMGGGSDYRSPQIYLYGGTYDFASGGVVSLTTADEPSISVASYNVSGVAQVEIYRADLDSLLDYLVHDSEGKQLAPKPNISDFEHIGSTTASITGNDDRISLPLDGKGIWYVSLNLGSTTADAYIIRSDHGAVVKEGDNEFVFWVQSFSTKKSADQGEITLYDLEGQERQLATTTLGSDGLAQRALTAEADIGLLKVGDDLALIPINLHYLNTGNNYEMFQEKAKLTRQFIFTDRPIYQPGDTVYFKSVLRRDDDARYSIPTGEAKVTITSHSSENDKFEATFPISVDGEIDGKYELPKDSKVGYYSLSINVEGDDETGFRWGEYVNNSTNFQVQHYQKPEMFISVDTPELEYISGDQAKVVLKGEYFSGQPLIGQELKYKVTAVDYWEYYYYEDQLNRSLAGVDSYYGMWYGGQLVTEGTATLDKRGQAEVSIDTKQLERQEDVYSYTPGQSKVFVIESTLEDGSQTPAFSRKNFLVYAGEYGIYRTDHNYGTVVNTEIEMALKLGTYFNKVDLSGVSLNTKIHRETWVRDDSSDTKYPTYHKEEEDLSDFTLKTNNKGEAKLSFKPGRTGSYTITVEGRDSRDNLISKKFYVYVYSHDTPSTSASSSSGNLSVAVNKDRYNPDDEVQVTLTSNIPDRDVFLSLERGRMDRYQLVHLSGKEATVTLPLQVSDVPNIYLTASSFSDYYLDTYQLSLPVSADGKKLVVNIEPDLTHYGPGETAEIKVTTTNLTGKPVAAELALWAVDKAIFELSDSNLGNIFDTFWSERSDTTAESHSLSGIRVQMAEGGGCFPAGTLVTLASGKTKNIEDLHAGDQLLTLGDSGPVTPRIISTHESNINGYLTINDRLRVTSDHIIRLNDSWQTAGSAQVGDFLTDSNGAPVPITSVEWHLAPTKVYNLEVEDVHTFIADGFLVHNQKGDTRSVLEDTAYWNPSLHTDSSGQATVRVKLPDNLTTWTFAAVGSTLDSVVGQNTKDLIVTKDVIVRPILPNLMRLGDQLYVTALVQNFTDKDHTFGVELKFDSGEVIQSTWESLGIPAGQTQPLVWQVIPKKENEAAKLTFTALASDARNLGDSIEMTLPVIPYGFYQKRAETGHDSVIYELALEENISDKTTATLSLSPTLLGILPTAMKYLIDYPYGCVEQTVSRLAATIVASENKELFADALKNKNVDDIIKRGLSELEKKQHGDGGWSWWYSGASDPFITAYVIEYLTRAKALNLPVDDNLYQRALNYLRNPREGDNLDTLIARHYGLSMAGEQIEPLTNLSNLDSDLLSLAVIANYQAGIKDKQVNGLALLETRAKAQGDGAYWPAGSNKHFGSTEASTALALRAMVLAGGDEQLLTQAVMYLSRSRQRDYWANTFATTQVINALVDYGEAGDELDPYFTFEVLLNGEQLADGEIFTYQDKIEDLVIPLAQITKDSKLEIKKEGNGELYSTLVVNEFLTNQNYQGRSHGLSLTRTYENTRGSEYPLAVGDTALVKLTVSGLGADDNFGVIADELPAGMVPINPSLKNESYETGTGGADYYQSYLISDAEVTKNGVVLSLYNLSAETREYTYKARVVSEGEFAAPPATVALMYSPEIYGLSSSQRVKIEREPISIPGRLTNNPLRSRNFIAILLSLIALATLTLTILKKKGKLNLHLPKLKLRLPKLRRHHLSKIQVNDHPKESLPKAESVEKEIYPHQDESSGN